MTYDPKWSKQSWFDGAFRYAGLRQTQQFNVDNVFENGELFIGDLRNKLLGNVSLLALTCGAGKTVLMLAFLFAICEEVNRRQKVSPRPSKVLWFCHQSQIGRQLMSDLKADIGNHRLVATLPSITICDETGDLDRGPGHHDIVISCPHALWGGKNQRRSDIEIESLLAQYDVIIWDECDFARDQIDRLVRLSPHALKFGLTAAPIDADGKFIRNNFVLAATASHSTVFREDSCLAPMLPWQSALDRGYVQAVKHDGFSRDVSGVEHLEKGAHGEKYSLPGTMSAIRQAVHDCIEHEREIRQKWSSHWFSPHIFVACNGIDEAIELCQQTALDLSLMGLSPNDGWYPTYMVSSKSITGGKKSSEHNRPKNESSLFYNNPDMKHPFMLALDNNGRCVPGSSRIIFVVDIAVRGLNHWGLKYVVDVKRSASWSEQVQTIGRTSRLPAHLKEMREAEMFDWFCHPRWYFPHPGNEDKCPSAAADAWEFILQMDARLETSGLLSWSDLMKGLEIEPIEGPVDANAPFTLMDRLQIDNELGSLIKQGKQVTPEDVGKIVCSLPDPQSESRTESAEEHIRQVLTSRDYRETILQPRFDILRPISSEAPKDIADYTTDELCDWYLRDGSNDPALAELIGTDPNIRKLVAQQKRKYDQQHFRAVTKIRQLIAADGKPGVLTNVRNALLAELTKQGFDYRVIIGPTSKAVYTAAAKMCGLTGSHSTENNGPLDRPWFHYQFSIPSIKNKLKSLALADLIMRGVVGPAQHLYGDLSEESDVA